MAPFTPLLRPDRYFAEREINFFRVMAVVALLIATGPLTIYGVGWILTANVDGSVMIDNPERPPESYCANTGGCDEPRQVERDVDAVIWGYTDEVVGVSMLVYPVAAVVVALLLHAGVWLAGPEQGLFATFAVAAWGLVPSAILIAVSLVGLAMVVGPITVTAGADLGTTLEPLQDQVESVTQYMAVGTVVSAAWGGLIWRFGLVHEQGLPGAEATLIAGVVATLYAAVGLLS